MTTISSIAVVADRAHLVPLDEFESTMKPGMVDLAVNIHSFSECTLEAITWWLRQLMRIKVPYLMLIPNEPDKLLTREHDDRRVSFRPVLEQLGFEQAADELIYQDSVISEFIKNDRIFLFRVPGAHSSARLRRYQRSGAVAPRSRRARS